jgi:hypothetical protein
MKKRLHDRKRLMQFALSLCLILVSTNSSWGQQVIGSYPVMDGGFEGQALGVVADFDALATSGNWTKGAGSGTTTTISNTGSGDTGPRSGSKYAIANNNSGTINRQLISPQVTSGWPTSATSHIVQYYVRNSSATLFSIPVGIGPTGGGYAGDGRNATTTWAKVAQVVTPSSTTALTAYTSFRSKLSAAGAGSGFFDVDDVVIYAGTAVDGTAPEAATAVATPVSGTNVRW